MTEAFGIVPASMMSAPEGVPSDMQPRLLPAPNRPGHATWPTVSLVGAVGVGWLLVFALVALVVAPLTERDSSPAKPAATTTASPPAAIGKAADDGRPARHRSEAFRRRPDTRGSSEQRRKRRATRQQTPRRHPRRTSRVHAGPVSTPETLPPRAITPTPAPAPPALRPAPPAPTRSTTTRSDGPKPARPSSQPGRRPPD